MKTTAHHAPPRDRHGNGLRPADSILTRYPKDLPPTYGNLLRMGDTFTYAAQRALLPGAVAGQGILSEGHHVIPSDRHHQSRCARRAGIQRHLSAAAERGVRRLAALCRGTRRFAANVQLADLKALRSRTQITRHTCEEGWTAIGQWTGVPLSAVLDAAGILPTARFVMFHSYDDWVDSIDLLDAFHPQTILAYGMNGRDLPIPHGAPLRLRVERQMGYKSMKYLQRVVVVDEFDDGGKQGNIQNGWAWYTGI